ncbi:hypothetical protein TSTA_024130 [Talaromyces stipitatus ATCC 10500]|uniref:Uncharacterized protein n=1 Tax=Talaromyces stipitatus (strain ATCC 10500 / CBS 375.48 / QM 6759 / NRRL 1006) TaxID=441959 RepID=B8M680_TALSN|nr:uncharacterized protein TSTA_024130 [Talaromyces stipitatus ATCC 10500]EED19080.1 hypothetical protein TSTA_024130 [Talaromyces stipitatus ATCC 10500]
MDCQPNCYFLARHKDLTHKHTTTPPQITFAPIILLMGTYLFIALGLPIMQASALATYLEYPTEIGGYGFSSLQTASFTMTAWIGMIAAQVDGYPFNDKIPL